MNLREGRIGFQEAVCVAVVSMGSKAIFIGSQILSGSGSGLWQSCLLSAFWSLIFLALVFFVLRRTGAPGLMEAFSSLFGPALGGVAKLCLGTVQFLGAMFLAENFVIMLRHYVMENSPEWFVALLLIIGAFPLSWMGLEAITRASKIIVFLAGGALLLTILGAFSSFELFRLFPLGGPGVKSIAVRSIQQSLFWSDALILTTLPDALQRKKTMKRSALTATFLSSGAVFLCILALSLSFAYPLLSKLTVPIYKLSGVSLSGHVRRLGESMPYFWLMGAIIAIAFGIYQSALIYCRLFSIRDIRAVLPALFSLLFFSLLLSCTNLSWVQLAIQIICQWGWILLAAPVILSAFLALGRRKPNELEKSTARSA